MLLKATFVVIIGAVGLTAMPDSASACGIKSVGVGSAVSQSSDKTANPGRMIVYGDTKVSRRLALAIKAAGHRVKRSTKVGSADLVLTSTTLASAAQQDFKNTTAVVVVILAEGEKAASGVKYAVRMTDRVNQQLAVVEQALKARRGV